MPLIAFLLVLGLLVFIHELGHFLFAKRAGILVREFAIGFGPKLFSKRVGETLYSIRILPLGGYVRMAGEDPELVEIKTGSSIVATQNEKGKIDHLYLYQPKKTEENALSGHVIEIDMEKDLFVVIEDETEKSMRYPLDAQAILHFDPKTEMQIAPLDRQFGSKTVGQKAATIFAGPLFNVLLTVVLFIIFVMSTGVQYLTVDKVLADKPADQAGMKVGDKIVAINDHRVHSRDSYYYHLVSNPNQTVQMTVERDGQRINLPMKAIQENGTYQIGVQLVYQENPAFLESVKFGLVQTGEWTLIMLDSFKKLITGQLSIESLGGPVQMGHATGQIAENVTEVGFSPMIKWMALLSLNLGIVNLLPIPALDGSRLVFIGLEGLRGRPINPNKESIVHFVGFAFLMVLMLVVTYNDIMTVFFDK